jgi:hypothetical protein
LSGKIKPTFDCLLPVETAVEGADGRTVEDQALGLYSTGTGVRCSRMRPYVCFTKRVRNAAARKQHMPAYKGHIDLSLHGTAM